MEAQVCDDKTPSLYVAQGLIKRRFRDIGRDHLPRVARKLLDDAEGRTNDCPNLKGLNADSIAQLRKWAAQPIAEAKPQEKSKPEDKPSPQ